MRGARFDAGGCGALAGNIATSARRARAHRPWRRGACRLAGDGSARSRRTLLLGGVGSLCGRRARGADGGRGAIATLRPLGGGWRATALCARGNGRCRFAGASTHLLAIDWRACLADDAQWTLLYRCCAGLRRARLYRQRLSRLALQGLLAGAERRVDGRRRWCTAGYGLTLEHFTCRRGLGRLRRADQAACRRRHLRESLHFAAGGAASSGADQALLHCPTTGEHLLRHHRVCPRILAMHVVHLRQIAAAHIVIVVDVHDRGVVDHGVVHVDAGEVVAADAIGREPHVARTEREPADGTHAAGKAQAPVAAADEGDQRGRVHGAIAALARDPAPAVADLHPASVMGHREAPGRVIHPGPAERLDPAPVAVAVGRPAAAHACREPHRAIVAHRVPAAVAVELGVADQIVRDVAQRWGVVHQTVAVKGEVVEVVGTRRSEQAIVAQAGIVETHLLALTQVEAGAFTIGLGSALPDGDIGVAAVGVDIDAVAARLADDHGHGWRGDLVDLVLPDASHVDVEAAFGEEDLRVGIVEIEDLGAAQLVEAHGCGTQLQLDARAAVGPQPVTADQRTVDHRTHPVVLAGRREADVAIEVADARHAARRVEVGGHCRRRGKRGQHQPEQHRG